MQSQSVAVVAVVVAAGHQRQLARQQFAVAVAAVAAVVEVGYQNSQLRRQRIE